MAPKKKQKVSTKTGPVARDTTQPSMSLVDSARAESGEIRKPRSCPKTVKSMVRHALSDSSLRECSPETIDGRTYEGQTLRQRLEIAKQQELDNPKTVSFGRKDYETLILQHSGSRKVLQAFDVGAQKPSDRTWSAMKEVLLKVPCNREPLRQCMLDMAAAGLTETEFKCSAQ
eukprot:3178165-Amphidinium_carterae.1